MRLPFFLAATCALALAAVAPAPAVAPVHPGTLTLGRVDGITDVPGVRVGQVTKTAGKARTGVTVVVPSADPWAVNLAAGFFAQNGNGEMTGIHYVDEFGFLQTPIALTNTLDVGRVYDGVIDWMLAVHPEIGVSDGVPLPIVAECDDQGINDIQGRYVSAADTAAAIRNARPGDFARGSAGAGTGMHLYGFKGGIGSASRVLPANLGGYTVGVLLNANFGQRAELHVLGVPLGEPLRNELLPVFRRAALAGTPASARTGSVVAIVATDAPLDTTVLRAIAKRVSIGLARTGTISHVSSGDLFLAFSTTHGVRNDGAALAQPPLVTDESRIDALYAATADATEEAVYDALFSATTVSGANGNTLYALPFARVRPILQRAGVLGMTSGG